MVPDENSMEDPLCNSTFGSMVSLDYVTPDTPTAPERELSTEAKLRRLAARTCQWLRLRELCGGTPCRV